MKPNHLFPVTVLGALLLSCAGALAQLEATPIPTLTVHGRGEVTVRPDQATIRLGAMAQAGTAAAAQEEVSRTIQATLERVKELNIPERSIRTAGISLQPVFSREPRLREAEPEIVGFRAGNILQVQVDDLDLVGKVIDAGVRAGANRVESLAFGLRDDTDARTRALAQALQQARTKAQAMAGAMDIRLGELHEVIEQPIDFIRPMEMHRAVALEAATPVQPGELRLEASVVVRYRIPGQNP